MAAARIDLTGSKFGRLEVVRFLERRTTANGRRYFWLCKCDCGEDFVADGASLRRSMTKSCGCYRTEVRTKHGQCRHRLYKTWLGMKQRCGNPKNPVYRHYGGRGISVCERWKVSFPDFLSDVGERPSPAYSLERINNSGDYEPSNVKWATMSEQNENSRQTKLIEFDGVTLSIGKWARRLKISPGVISRRIGKGMNPSDVMRFAIHLSQETEARKCLRLGQKMGSC